MIKVNLLPEHLRVKKKDFNFPIFPILIGVFIVLFSIYLILVFKIHTSREIVGEMDQALSSVRAKSTKSQESLKRLQKLQNIIDNVVYKSLIPRYSVTGIMDVINTNIPEGIWLTELNYFTDEEGPKLRLRGFVKPVYNETMIAVIGQLNDALKEYFENVAHETNLPVITGDIPTKEIDFSLTTKRRQAEKIEITEFSTVFSL